MTRSLRPQRYRLGQDGRTAVPFYVGTVSHSMQNFMQASDLLSALKFAQERSRALAIRIGRCGSIQEISLIELERELLDTKKYFD